MNTSELSHLIDKELDDFTAYVDANYGLHDKTPVLAEDLYEYSHQILDTLSSMKNHIIDYLNQQ